MNLIKIIHNLYSYTVHSLSIHPFLNLLFLKKNRKREYCKYDNNINLAIFPFKLLSKMNLNMVKGSFMELKLKPST